MASSVKEQALALYEDLKVNLPDIDEEVRVAVYNWAKKAVAKLERVDTIEAKISMLMTAVYYAAVNGHEYGPLLSNPELHRMCQDLKNCRRQDYLDALDYEACNLILRAAMNRRANDGL